MIFICKLGIREIYIKVKAVDTKNSIHFDYHKQQLMSHTLAHFTGPSLGTLQIWIQFVRQRIDPTLEQINKKDHLLGSRPIVTMVGNF